MLLKGISASPGIILGTVFCISQQSAFIDCSNIESDRIPIEQEKLDKAIAATKLQLTAIQEEAKNSNDELLENILDVQISILSDRDMIEEIYASISDKLICAANAVDQVFEQYAKQMENMDNDYLRERAADIRDVGSRVVRSLLGVSGPNLQGIPDQCVIVAEELTPSETAQLPKEKIIGMCVEHGGKTSHVAIIAKNMGIPAVVGVSNLMRYARTGSRIIVDAQQETIILDPNEEARKNYEKKKTAYDQYLCNLQMLRGKPAQMMSGEQVRLYANIAQTEDTKIAKENGAEGIGLYRTEFLYMHCDDFPTEDAQFAAYRAVTESASPVTIRTLDIGGDKDLSYFTFPEEQNPFLGWRAIRICLEFTEMFKTQLRAILRASHYGTVRIMYPMISSIQEVRQANTLLEEAKEELRVQQIPFAEDIQVGAMIEIPSAALCVEQLLQELDFVCIGTNDLIQYTLAADRMNEKVSNVYQAFHPAVLRLIRHVIRTANAMGKDVSVCGEMAGSITAVPLLLGFGLRKFSMSAGAILHVKRVICGCERRQTEELAEWAIQQNDSSMIQEHMKRFLEDLM